MPNWVIGGRIFSSITLALLFIIGAYVSASNYHKSKVARIIIWFYGCAFVAGIGYWGVKAWMF